MGVTIECDGRIEVRMKPDAFHPLVLVYKHVRIDFYKDDKCDVDFCISVGRYKPSGSVMVTRRREGRQTDHVSFDFPYDLRNVAFDVFTEIAGAMNTLGMIDLASQIEE